jgi:hypothetical protein
MSSDPNTDSNSDASGSSQTPDPATQAEPQTVERGDPTLQAEPQSIEVGRKPSPNSWIMGRRPEQR